MPTTPRGPEPDLLLSAPLVGALALLVVNDHLLKPLFHNAVTGKLSDVAGLFALTLFCRALVPAGRTAICLTMAALWVWWKLPLSQPALDAWNAASVFPLRRVADATDLIALAVLPAAWLYEPRPAGRSRLARVAVCVTSVLAFTATRPAPSAGGWDPITTVAGVPVRPVWLTDAPEHELAMSKREFVRRVQLLWPHDFDVPSFAGLYRGPGRDILTITTPGEPDACDFVRLRMEVRQQDGRAVVRPLRADMVCSSRAAAERGASRAFDERVIRRVLDWSSYRAAAASGPAPIDIDPPR